MRVAETMTPARVRTHFGVRVVRTVSARRTRAPAARFSKNRASRECKPVAELQSAPLKACKFVILEASEVACAKLDRTVTQTKSSVHYVPNSYLIPIIPDNNFMVSILKELASFTASSVYFDS
jgi:hypothetical protein